MLACALAQWATHAYSGFAGLFLLLPGIFAAGLIFDRGTSFFATLLGTALSLYSISPDLKQAQTALPLGLFVITGALCGLISEIVRNLLERLAAAERTKDLLLQEVLHRTKNNIMNIGSLLVLQSRATSNEEARDALNAAASRVRAMVDIHDFLRYSGNEQSVKMDAYLDDLTRKLADSLRGARPIAINVAAEPLDMREYKAVAIGLIVNELITNSLKYAFPNDRPGRIDVSLRAGADDFLLEVSDNGVGCPENAKDGLGTRLMNLMTQQIGGTLERETTPNGCRAMLRIPRQRHKSR